MGLHNEDVYENFKYYMLEGINFYWLLRKQMSGKAFSYDMFRIAACLS